MVEHWTQRASGRWGARELGLATGIFSSLACASSRANVGVVHPLYPGLPERLAVFRSGPGASSTLRCRPESHQERPRCEIAARPASPSPQPAAAGPQPARQ
jgi:hypothetical protein